MATQNSKAFDSDILHEVRCHKDGCNTVMHCTCGRMKHHEISTDLNFCGLHRRHHDPAYDPDDTNDWGIPGPDVSLSGNLSDHMRRR